MSRIQKKMLERIEVHIEKDHTAFSSLLEIRSILKSQLIIVIRAWTDFQSLQLSYIMLLTIFVCLSQNFRLRTLEYFSCHTFVFLFINV